MDQSREGPVGDTVLEPVRDELDSHDMVFVVVRPDGPPVEPLGGVGGAEPGEQRRFRGPVGVHVVGGDPAFVVDLLQRPGGGPDGRGERQLGGPADQPADPRPGDPGEDRQHRDDDHHRPEHGGALVDPSAGGGFVAHRAPFHRPQVSPAGPPG